MKKELERLNTLHEAEKKRWREQELKSLCSVIQQEISTSMNQKRIEFVSTKIKAAIISVIFKQGQIMNQKDKEKRGMNWIPHYQEERAKNQEDDS